MRKTPFRHAFDYPVHMLELDLDDLPSAFSGNRLWSLDAANFGSFRRSDHLDGRADLAGAARAAVAERLGFEPTGSVHLVCLPRHFGYAFNPVTFYLFRSAPGGLFRSAPGGEQQQPSHDRHRLDAILLEVSNTPWKERHLYALDCRDRSGPWQFELAKAFHVSPFMPMDMRYKFRFELDDQRFQVIKENLQDGESVFVARMDLLREPLTAAGLTRALRDLPPVTLRVIAAIYWQALRLWLRGARYHPRPRRDAGSGPE